MCDGVMFFVIVRLYKERQLGYTIIHYLTMIWSNMFVYTTVDIGYSKKKNNIFPFWYYMLGIYYSIMQLIILLIINNNYQGCYFLMCDGVTFFVIVRLYKERQLHIRYIIIHYLTMIWSNMFVWYYCRHNTCMVSLVYS